MITTLNSKLLFICSKTALPMSIKYTPSISYSKIIYKGDVFKNIYIDCMFLAV